MNIQKNILLANHTTFRLGGPARYFITAKTEPDIIEAVKFAKIKKLPYFILGNGSNLLVSDNGFNGLVIKIQNTKYRFQDTKIIAEAGISLNKLVRRSIEQGLTGLEWAIGIPGTVGGAVRGNAGAFGHSISELVKEIKVLNNKFQVLSFKFSDCKFGYRHSIFKQNNDIVISAIFQLKKGNFKKSQEMLKNYLKQKKERQPLEYFSAGCIFKNPNSRSVLLAAPFLKRARPKGRTLSAGYFIEQGGLKGKKIGRAIVSKKHANFIINLGGAKARDVIKLIQLIKKTVQKKFKITLEEEIEYLST